MLKDLKILLGIPEDDTSQDSKLNLILSGTRSRLKALLGGQDPPESLGYIITDVAVIRFNKIGSEGFLLTVLKGRASLFRMMILQDTVKISRHIWTVRRRQREVG